MRIFLMYAYLFFIGSTLGWVIEFIYRNRPYVRKKWINPGFCTGPYLPVYGFGLCVIFSVALQDGFLFVKNPLVNKVILFAIMACLMTVLEYVAGLFCIKVLNVRLWDYSDRKFNIQGIICPTFAFYWMAGGAAYYFLLHPHILTMLGGLWENPSHSFFIGIFFGVFLVDVCHSAAVSTGKKKRKVNGMNGRAANCGEDSLNNGIRHGYFNEDMNKKTDGGNL